MKYSDYIQEIEKDAEYNEAKEALKARFALGDAVLRARLKKGWSQTVLAKRVGTKQANVSRIESGLANPTLNLIQKLMGELDLEINFIPTPTSTTTKIIYIRQPGIAVNNWPGYESASNTQGHVLLNGAQR